jgi:hypothetical protein
VMECVKTWLSSQAADFFDTSIQKLIAQWHVPQFWRWLCWEVAQVCMYFLYIIIFLVTACFVNSSPESTFWIALILLIKPNEWTAWYNSNTLDFNGGGVLFKSRPEHQLSWLGFFMAFLNPTREFPG